jgi:16S rRNA (guanine527-N7)-methyltransferase
VSGEPAPELVDVLHEAQRLGFLGARPIPDVIDHARGFVRALAHGAPVDSVLDLGSGGGIPGLVIAHDLPDARVTLLDRRAKRTDVLERVVRRLGWQGRVTVRCQDVETFEPEERFAAAVARGFGPPEFTLTHASRLVRPGGTIVVSEPPATDRWDPTVLAALQLHRVPWPTTESLQSPDPARDPIVDTARDGGLDGLVAVFVRR